MVQVAVDRAPHRALSSEIAVGNQRSMAIARAAGFQLNRTVGDMMVWRRPRQSSLSPVGEPAVPDGGRPDGATVLRFDGAPPDRRAKREHGPAHAVPQASDTEAAG